MLTTNHKCDIMLYMNTVNSFVAIPAIGGNMTVNEITFSPEKSLEAIIYIASKLKTPTIHEILKVRYFADKLHLARYGWMASGDDYVAMKFGPVGSGTYNLLKAARGDASGFIHPLFSSLVDGALTVESDRRSIRYARGADLSQLSIAEIKCLDEALSQHGNIPFNDRTERSHDAAWQKAWNAASDDEIGASPIAVTSIAETLDNASEVLAHLRA
jgi:hypothetical protein